MRYGPRDVRKGIQNPEMVKRAVHRDLRLVNQWWARGGRKTRYNPDGRSIHERDWDNLIIIDACRYDTFAELHPFDGDLESFRSLGSSSSEFVRANFAGQRHHDLVITSANGWYVKVYQEDGFSVHDMEMLRVDANDHEIYDRFAAAGRTGWLMPGPVTERAQRNADAHPNKRHVIHYHQPHTPYIGPTGLEYFEELPHKLGWIDGDAGVADDIVARAYRENVEIALEAVADLLPHLQGKTVISADHGEMVCDRGFPVPIKHYGHRPGYYTDALTKVPWFVVEHDERRTIVEDEPAEEYDVATSADDVDDRLQNLGYKV